jgi:FtsP/CotA-like multicopper oxidase with cupredoxin domain
VLNATNARYLRLALTGHTLTLIGTDGGLLRAPVPGLDEILLAPAERVEVIVTASLAAGSTAVLQSLSYDRGGMGMMGTSSKPLEHGSPVPPARHAVSGDEPPRAAASDWQNRFLPGATP